MKRALISATVCGFALLFLAPRAQAQGGGFVFLGGGATIPTGDFKNVDMAKTGWIAQGGAGLDLSKAAWVEAEGWYGSNKHDDGSGDKTDIQAGLVTLGYQFTPGAKGSLYVAAGGGLMNHKYVPATGSSENHWKGAMTGAVGYVGTLSGSTRFWVEGRYLHMLETGGTTIMPITAGLSFNFGGK